MSVRPTHMESSSKGHAPVGGNITLWCMSQASNPPVTLRWQLDGKHISSDYITSTSFGGRFHGTKVESTAVISAQKNMNGHIVTCTPIFEGVALEQHSKQYLMNVTCLYAIFSACYTFCNICKLLVSQCSKPKTTHRVMYSY